MGVKVVRKGVYLVKIDDRYADTCIILHDLLAIVYKGCNSLLDVMYGHH